MAAGSTAKKQPTFNEAYRRYAPLSFCSTTIHGGVDAGSPLTFVHIQLKGPIAHVPALKNQKIRGTNILRPKARALLTIMDKVFLKSLVGPHPKFDGEIFCLVLCAYRKVTFDEDNMLTTIRDWLEPRMIRNHDRGWGIGIIDNDRKVNAFAIKKSKLDFGSDITDIYLRPMGGVVKQAREDFIKQIITA